VVPFNGGPFAASSTSHISGIRAVMQQLSWRNILWLKIG
jgi:hypothetical protein